MKWILIHFALGISLALLVSDEFVEKYSSRYAVFLTYNAFLLGWHVAVSSEENAKLLKGTVYFPGNRWWSPLRLRSFMLLGLAGVFFSALKDNSYYSWMASGLCLVLVWCVYSNGRARKELLNTIGDFHQRYRET
jgi:hypothetical protein